MRCVIDFETRSAIDIKKHGANVYAEDLSTEVLCLAVKQEGLPPVIWKRGDDPAAILALIAKADEIVAHNLSFETAIWENICVKRMGWPPLDTSKLRCSMAQACMHALPRSLGEACRARGQEEKKDFTGYRIMLKVCRPRKPLKDELTGEFWEDEPNKLYWNEDPKDLELLYKYCMQDVVAEEQLSMALSPLPGKELEIWRLDQKINSRGIQIDIPSAKNMIAFTDEHEDRLLKRLAILTNGKVKTAKQVEALGDYLRKYLKCDLPDLTAAMVTEGLKWDLHPDAREILEIRQSLGRSSSAKYQSMLDRASSDGRVRGSMIYHGASTGRWASVGLQVHNMIARIQVSDKPEVILNVINQGGLGLFQMLYDDDPMSAAGALVRSVLAAPDGKELIAADYSAIEGRGLAWLAGEESELENYRNGLDVYIANAARILHKSYDQVTKAERQSPGKISVLACIAEGELVLTDQGEIPIEKVSIDMRVWDGVEYVSHEGIVFRGYQEVIGYEGLLATPDHVVFTQEGNEIELREAAWGKQRLVPTGFGGNPIRVGESNIPGYPYDREGVASSPRTSLPMPRVQGSKMDRYEQPIEGENGRMSEVQPAGSNPEVAPKASYCREKPLPEPKRSSIQKLRGKRDKISIQDGHRGGVVDNQEFGVEEKFRNRQGQQRGALRTGKYSMDYPVEELQQCPNNNKNFNSLSQIQGTAPRDKVCGQHAPQPIQSGVYVRADNQEIPFPELQTKRRVWDILHAGPRNRFTVSGVLVHNCGYGGSVGAVRKFGGDDLDGEEIKTQIVKPWRGAHPQTVAFWYDLERACMGAVQEPGKIFSARSIGFRVSKKFLQCRLPSGRLLYYYDPEIQPMMTWWGEMKDSVTYMTVDGMTKKWIRTNTYGGKLAENVVSATCRDIMAEAMRRLEAAEYPIVMTVHDEIVAEVPVGFGSVEEFERIMCEVPKWAVGFPISASGWRGKRYRK